MSADLRHEVPEVRIRGEMPQRKAVAQDPERPVLELSRGRRHLFKRRPSTTVAVLLLAACLLMLVDLRGGPTHVLRSVGSSVGGSLQSWADRVLGPSLHGWANSPTRGRSQRGPRDWARATTTLERACRPAVCSVPQA